MKLPTPLFALAVTAAVTVGTATAQQEPKQAPERAAAAAGVGAKAPFVFEAGEIALEDLIERCSTYLQRNILCNTAELMSGGGNARPRGRGAPPAADAGPTGPTVVLQLPVVTDRDGCEELLTSILWSHGCALVPLDEPKGVYEVIARNGQRAGEILTHAVQRTPEQVLARPTLKQFVTVVYPLQHTNATIATNALRPFFASAGNNNGIGSLILGNVGNATSLVLAGPQDMVANVLILLQTADVQAPPEPRPELEARLDALAKQNAALEQRIAALEQKLAGTGR